MDKKWLGILVILLVGIGCMYIIVEHSPTVGKAVTVVDEMTITLPSGFNILKEAKKSVDLMDHGNHTANVTIIGLGDTTTKRYDSALKSLEKNDEIKVQSKNETIKTIKYKNLTSDNEYSLTYFERDNRTVQLKMDIYDDWQNDWKFITETVQHNFKQNK